MGLLNKIFSFLFSSKKLSRTLNPEKKIKVHGLHIVIRKVNPIDYLSGMKAMRQVWELYKRKDQDALDIDEKSKGKILAHYTDFFMAGVISVQGLSLSRDPVDYHIYPEKLYVQNLFNDWGIAEEIYQAIAEFTWGKKKIKQSISPKKS